MLQKWSAPQLPPPRPQSLLESSPPPSQLPALVDSILDEDDDLIASQQTVHGGKLSTESDQSSVYFHSKAPPSTYLSLPAPSPSPALASPLSTPPLAPAPPAPPACLSTSEDRDLSGSQTNGSSHSATDRSGSPLQPFPLQMRMIVTLMTPLTSSMCIQSLLSSPEHTSSPSSTLTPICGMQHVRKRWKLTE